MKVCIRCHETKPLTEFHKHKGMLDGHLNKCSPCVVKTVSEWRIKNPSCRKVEHARDRERKGFKTRGQYLIDKRNSAVGRNVTASKYAHKRRMLETLQLSEFDEFVIQEALILTKMRERSTGFKWHMDHIVPLMHKKACGLHNGFNVQVVPATWNVKKGNRNMDTYFPLVVGY